MLLLSTTKTVRPTSRTHSNISLHFKNTAIFAYAVGKITVNLDETNSIGNRGKGTLTKGMWQIRETVFMFTIAKQPLIQFISNLSIPQIAKCIFYCYTRRVVRDMSSMPHTTANNFQTIPRELQRSSRMHFVCPLAP